MQSYTLVGQPFCRLHCLWPGTEGHEISLDDLLAGGKPQGVRPWEVIGAEHIFFRSHDVGRYQDKQEDEPLCPNWLSRWGSREMSQLPGCQESPNNFVVSEHSSDSASWECLWAGSEREGQGLLGRSHI